MASAEPETLKQLFAEVEMRIRELEGQVSQQREILREMHGDGHALSVMQELLTSFEQKLTACIEERARLRAAVNKSRDI
jgi:hypothetical protein